MLGLSLLMALRCPVSSVHERSSMRLGSFCRAALRRARKPSFPQAGGAGQHNLVSSLSSDANHMWAAVEFEKRSGFQNSKGKVHFDVFMSKQLERMEQFCPLHLRRELSGIRQRGLQYSAWSEEQRQEHCAKLREAMTALAWHKHREAAPVRAPQQAAPALRSLRAPSAYITGRQRYQNGPVAGSSSDALHQGYDETLKANQKGQQISQSLLAAKQTGKHKLAAEEPTSKRQPYATDAGLSHTGEEDASAASSPAGEAAAVESLDHADCAQAAAGSGSEYVTHGASEADGAGSSHGNGPAAESICSVQGSTAKVAAAAHSNGSGSDSTYPGQVREAKPVAAAAHSNGAGDRHSSPLEVREAGAALVAEPPGQSSFSWTPPASSAEEGHIHERGQNGAHSPEMLLAGADEALAGKEPTASRNVFARQPQNGSSALAMPGSNGSTQHPGLYPRFEPEPEYELPPPAGDAGTATSFSAGREDLGLDPCCLSSKYKVVVFDTETSGGSAHKVVELGAYALESGDKFCTLINPSPVQIMDEVVAVHGITNEQVRAPGVPSFREAGAAFICFVEQQAAAEAGSVPVVLAHNFCGFDYKKMSKEFKDAGLEWPRHWHFIDTLPLARRLFPLPLRNRQSDLVERFSIPVPDRVHRALDDVMILAQIVPHLLLTSPAGDLNGFMAHSAYQVQPGENTGICGKLTHFKPEKSAKQEARRRMKEAAEVRKARAALQAAMLSVAAEDPIHQIEKMSRRRPREHVVHEEGRARDLVPQLPSSWVDILQNRVISRPQVDVATDSRKSPFSPKQQEHLAKVELTTVGEVLQYYPRDYQTCEYALRDGQYATVVGTVVKNDGRAMRERSCMDITLEVDPDFLREIDPDNDAEISGDGSSQLETVNYQKYVRGKWSFYGVQNSVAKLQIGEQAIAQGRVFRDSRGRWELDAQAQLTPFDPAKLPPTIVPVYAAKSPVTPKEFEKAIPKALEKMRHASREEQQLWDCLPSFVRRDFDLMGWFEAVQEMHEPSSHVELEEARRRLAFEELLLLQLTLLLRRELSRAPRDAVDAKGALMTDLALMEVGKAALPYRLTGSQERVLQQILEDMQAPLPMLRLLQGDVGCGKTVVAFLALLAAAGSGFQGAMMAPTEVLTEQHFRGMKRLLERMPPARRPQVAMLTGSTKPRERRETLAALADGQLQILIGTHALISDNVSFAKLGLAVIDEQHKFGVEQRAKLQSKASPLPHVLAMTATPIPRTLALVTQGDMAFCAIDEMPPGRREVATTVIQDRPADINQMYAEVKEEVAAGGRAFIIYPLIEESSTERFVDVKAAEEEYAKLRDSMKLGQGVECGLLHGRMAADEKQAAVARFSSGETPVLVSTSVVEVGMDVPEASIMIVNHAERFGLAQLHQLRGRVGRGSRPSKCFLVNAGESSAWQRLGLLAQEHSGLQIAEADLAHRGQGDVMGKQQSGKDALACLRAAKLPEDRLLMEQARQVASELIERYTLDPAEWSPPLLAALARAGLPKLDYHHFPAAAPVKEQVAA